MEILLEYYAGLRSFYALIRFIVISEYKYVETSHFIPLNLLKPSQLLSTGIVRMYQDIFLVFDILGYSSLLTDLINDADVFNLYENLSLDVHGLEDDDLYEDEEDHD